MNSRGRILVMDDVASWRNVLRKTLEASKFHVDDCATMAETLQKLNETFRGRLKKYNLFL